MPSARDGVQRVVSLLETLAARGLIEPTAVTEDVTAVPQGTGHTWLRLRTYRKQPTTGKYLFFAHDPAVLVEVALIELRDHGFPSAKVSVRPSATGEHCLCLYWADDARCRELADRHPDVKFRGFKTDAATRAGVYSPLHRRGTVSALRAP